MSSLIIRFIVYFFLKYATKLYGIVIVIIGVSIIFVTVVLILIIIIRFQ